MSSNNVFAFLDEDGELVISTDSTAGEPCLCINVSDRDVVLQWIETFMRCLHDGEWDGDLPGRMAVIADKEDS